jgi:2-polyprenyl-6-hydroxyphenyl methylase/3-demethylubiquinone-9 3-methyltransferase
MSLTGRSQHFEFGENWREYAKTIDDRRIADAIAGLEKLFPDGVRGKSFLDIGSGSGLHSLAALSLGAERVLAVDIDENSVATTRQLLSARAPSKNWNARIASVFETSPQETGTFDIVYSWGVLHHTGDMWRAIEKAASLVKPDGQFALAIYGKTPFDAVWRAEKRIYKSSPHAVQWLMRKGWVTTLIVAKLARGKNPMSLFRDPIAARGMNFSHDLHDWLGGYPYETATVDQLSTRIGAMGFRQTRAFPMRVAAKGLFGSGCHEIVFAKG